MKTCPKCGASYADELSFCLQDGAPLPARSTAGISNAPTEAFRPGTNPVDDISAAETLANTRFNTTPARPTQFQMRATGPANKMGCVVTVGQVAAMVLVVFGLGAGGFYFLTRSDSALVASKRPPPDLTASGPANANYSANHSANSTVIPSDRVDTPPPLARPSPATTSSKTISAGVLNGKATSLPKPAYPPAAKAVRASGAVSVQVLVDEQGNVVSANAVSGHPLLRAAAAAAARGAKFEPTVLSGKPVKVSGVLTYSFVPE